MGLFVKFKAGLHKTHGKLAHEIKRVVTRSPKLDATALEELEAALIAADLGVAVTAHIVAAVKQAYETQGGAGTFDLNLNLNGTPSATVEPRWAGRRNYCSRSTRRWRRPTARWMPRSSR